ncbi:MAG: hypothetical protein NTAFB05_14400 [Nitrobacter sp.]|uniref:transglutaminase-like cysteine peptidase n=1 Tax=Nitrobacter sp. TaxID=29420 RepID=UPI00387DDE44
MLIGFRCRIVVTGTFLSLAILAGTTHESQAARKDRLKTHIFDDLITPSMLESLKPAPAPRTGGARFFSINGVLARLDGKAPPDQNVRVASTAGETVASDVPGPIAGAMSATQVSAEPFGLFTFKAPEGPLWRKWRALKANYDVEMRAVAACRSDPATCTPAASRFVALAAETKAHDGLARLETVNRLVNREIAYASDLTQHGVLDVWSAPLASLRSGRGDCEDYAIAKYALLREVGIAEQDLRILLVRDRSVREDHAVLAVRHRGSWIILDNRRATLAIDSEAGYLTPMYALNANGISLFASPYLSQRHDRNVDAVLPAADGADAAEGGGSSAPLVTFRIRDIVEPKTPAVLGNAGSEHPLLL